MSRVFAGIQHTAHQIADATPASVIIPIAATMPWWREVLHSVAGAAADIGILIGLLLAIVKLWDALTKLEATSRLKAGVAAVLALVGIVGFVAATTKRDAVQPLGIVSRAPVSKGKRRQADDGGNDGEADAGLDLDKAPKWLYLANSLIGTDETTREGARAVAAMFASAGHPELKPKDATTTPWCAAYVCHVLEQSGQPTPRSLMARSFMQWGRPISTPVVGCVVVLQRGARGGPFGHVGFYAGETATHVLVLGGNQSDKVCVAKFPKSRVLDGGYRMPRGIQRSVTMQGQAVNAATATAVGGAAATTEFAAPQKSQPVIDSLEQSKTIAEQLGAVLPRVMIVASLIAVAISCIVMYRRYQDYRATGG